MTPHLRPRPYLYIFLLLATTPLARLHAQETLADSILQVLEEGIAGGAFPGAQVLAWHHGQPLVHLTAGYHTYARLRPTRADDVYDLASITKTSSALLVLMQQYGQGQLDLGTPVGRLFPQLDRKDKRDRTLRSVLAHRAGLLPWVPYWQSTLRGQARYPWRDGWETLRTNDYRFRARTIRRDSSDRFPLRLTDDLWLHRKYRERGIYRAIAKSPVQPEGQYAYSGLLFYLLPDYVSRTTGSDYREYLRREFYDPLGATTLGYRPLDRGIPRDRIVPTEVDTFFRMDTLHGVVHDEGAAMMDGISANAGLFSNAEDLAKLWQMLLDGGTADGRRYLSEEAIAEFSRYQYPQESNRRGLGFDKPLLTYDAARSSVAEAASPASFGHSGYTGTFVWVDPEHELLYVFLSNRVHPSRERGAIYDLNIRPRIHALLYSLINRSE